MVGSLNDWQKERQFKTLNEKKEERGVKVIRDGVEKVIDIKVRHISSCVLLYIHCSFSKLSSAILRCWNLARLSRATAFFCLATTSSATSLAPLASPTLSASFRTQIASRSAISTSKRVSEFCSQFRGAH